MPGNVAEVIEGRARSLYEKLAQNQDLANVIMGFLGKIVMMCHQKGKPIQGVDCTDVHQFRDEFRFGISFNDLVISPMGLWQPQGDITMYAASRSVHLAKVLEKNARLMRTFTSLVDVVEKFCLRHNKPFVDFKVKKAFIHPHTNVCVIRAGAPELVDRFR